MQFATDVAVYTCICCPVGCRVEVSFDENGQVAEVSGHTCKRGADYAAQEAQQEQEQQELEREQKMQTAMLNIKKKFGKNAILRGMNLEEGATAKDRNQQIGGHKA